MSQKETLRTRPSVSRVESAEEYFSAEHRAELARMVEEPIRAEVEQRARIAELSRRAHEPLLRLVQEDADAMAALPELRKEILAGRPTRGNRPVEGFADVATFALGGMHPGINVISRPYDFEIDGPSSGSATITTDRLAGTHAFFLPSGAEDGGGRFATAGVGVTLRAEVTGVAHIRPSWRYDFDYWASGSTFGPNAQTVGSAIAVVQDANTHEGLGSRQVWLWNVSADSETGHGGADGGFIDSWGLALDVLIHEGQLFNVSLIASGYVEDDSFVFSSYAEGSLSMNSSFIVIEL